MKSVFRNFIGRALTGVILPSILAAAFSVGYTARAVDAVWTGAGIITTPPNIDAITFSNTAKWNIITEPRVFSTKDTLYYNNSGQMTNIIGWDFSLWPSTTGINAWSSGFTNTGQGYIMALSGIGGLTTQVLPVGYLLVSATNILNVNGATLAADASSEIILNGANVILSNSFVEVVPIQNLTTNSGNAGLYDSAWVQDTFPKTPSIYTGGLWDNTNFYEPREYGMTEPCGNSGTFGPSTINVANASYMTTQRNPYQVQITNSTGAIQFFTLYSNVFRQAVFVGTNLNMPSSSRLGFWPNLASNTNGFNRINVLLTLSVTNPANGAVDNPTLFVSDTLASAPDRGLVTGAPFNPYGSCSEPTFRPVNYTFYRGINLPNGVGFGGAGSGRPATNYFFPQDPFSTNSLVLQFTNPFVSPMEYAGYIGDVENLAAQFANGNSATNLPGRVTIFANNLNMTRTHIRAEGGVIIKANNLVSSAGATVDCQNLTYDLSSTNGSLTITNLGGLTVQRLHGTVRLWSATWPNTEQVILPNYAITNIAVTNIVGTNIVITTNMFPVSAPVTNIINVNLAVTEVDPSGLSLDVPVGLQSFSSHSTNTVINDQITVLNSLIFDGLSLTINGSLNVNDNPQIINLNANAGTLENFDKTVAPNLLYFTNNGTLIIPGALVLGADRPPGCLSVVNHGIITNTTESVSTAYYQDTGTNQIGGTFAVNAASGELRGALLNTVQEIDISGNSFKLSNSRVISGTTLNFMLTGALFDAGGGSGNYLSCINGFNLVTKPASGDLLGTTITNIGLSLSEVDSTWAGEDRGASVTGFSNNVALGTLTFAPQGPFEPLFTFAGTGDTNALYVDVLDLTALGTDYQNMLAINPNLVIYYASVKVGFTPPTINGVAQEPEEYLNGQFNNHLRWVSSFAGPNSSVAVLINGHTVFINRALRFSKLIDSNGNGIPNYYDTAPFDLSPFPVSGSLVMTNQPPAPAFGLSWSAAPNTVYQVQYTTNLISPNWQPLLNYTNNTTANVPVTLWDTNAGASQRFYRESVIVQFQ